MHTPVETKTAEVDVPSRHSTMSGGNGISKQGGEAEFPAETNGSVSKAAEWLHLHSVHRMTTDQRPQRKATEDEQEMGELLYNLEVDRPFGNSKYRAIKEIIKHDRNMCMSKMPKAGGTCNAAATEPLHRAV